MFKVVFGRQCICPLLLRGQYCLITSIIFSNFRFPKDNVLRQKWVRALRRQNFIPSRHAVVCSEHFSHDDFDRTSQCVVRLQPGSIPSVFVAFPNHLQGKTKKRPPPKPRNCTPSLMALTDSITASSPTVAAVPFVANISPSNVSLKRKLEDSERKLSSSRKRIKTLLQARRRLVKRNADLKNVITDLRKQAVVSSSSIDVLESCASGVAELLKRQKAKLDDSAVPTMYSCQLRSFALTLHFYSPRAYKYVRKVFDTCLPHPRTIRKWYQMVDDAPGFTQSAFQALKLRSEHEEAKPMICSLLMDEVSIRKTY